MQKKDWKKTPDHVLREIKRLKKTQPTLKATDIAKKLNVSHSVVYYHTKPLEQKMCEACKRRPVPTKPVNGVTLTKLCKYCYQEGRPTIIIPRRK